MKSRGTKIIIGQTSYLHDRPLNTKEKTLLLYKKVIDKLKLPREVGEYISTYLKFSLAKARIAVGAV